MRFRTISRRTGSARAARATPLQFGQSNRNWMALPLGNWGRMGSGRMNYKGIEYTINMIEPGVWKYRFHVGRAVKVGTTKVKLELLAIQRVQKRIDLELKIAGFYESA
jgi:hypothetical protein